MLVRKERLLLGNMVKDCFCVELLPFYLNQKIYMLRKWVYH